MTVPEAEPEEGGEPEATASDGAASAPVRESIRIQALLATIGTTMGFKIWIPAGDRARVLETTPELAPELLTRLPMNYDETTLQTIQNIDLLWI